MGVALLALFAGAACGGSSCSCLTPIPGGFNPNKRVPNAVQARVGMKGITYIEQHVQDVINAFVPGGLSQRVPPSCSGSTRICCENPDPMCIANVAVTSLALNPTPPHDIGMTVRAIVRSTSRGGGSDRFPVSVDTFLGRINCDVRIDTTRSGAQDLGVVGAVTLQSPADPVTDLTSAIVNVQDIVDLDDGDIDIGGGFACSIANFFKGFFIGTLRDQLKSKVQDAVNQQLCQKCQTGADCAPFSSTCQGGACMLGGSCIQQLGAQGRLDAGSLVAKFSPGLRAFLDLYMVAGHYADTNNSGISLGLLGGLEPVAHNNCVPAAEAPVPQPLPMSPTFDGNVNPNNNQPFDVAIGFHKWFLEHGGWAAWQAGVLCLNIGTKAVDLLNSGTFALLAPSMDDLTHGVTEPLIIAIRPAQAPQMTLGKGTFTTDPMGNKVIQDPLVTMTLPDFTMDFYLMSDDRFVRLFTLTSDVSLPLALDVDGQGKLVPIIGDVTAAFRNIRVSNSQLLSESPAALAMKFPTVLSVALPFIAKSLPPIALPQVMGIKLKVAPGGITSTDNNTMLAIFTDLQIGQPLRYFVETSAEVAALEVPPTAGFQIRADFDYATQTPAVHLRLGGVAADGTRNLEWQYRIDEGFWSVFQTRSDLTVRDPILLWQGRHVIEVRARVQGEPDTLDPTPVQLGFLIDTVPPQVSAEVVAGEVRVTAHDLVTPEGALRYSYARGAGGFVAMDGPVLAVGPGPLDELTLRVTDEAGNHGYVFFHGRETTTSGCNCALGGRDTAGTPGGALVALLAGTALLVRGRRRRGGASALAALVLAVTAAALAAGCGGDITGNGNPDGGPRVAIQGATGRWSDLAAGSGHVLVSAYEQHYGDLLVGTADSTGKLTYRIIDGVPNVQPTLDPSGYRGGIADPGDDVGLYTSIKLDAMGRARVSYFDAPAGALKLALARDQTAASWDIVTVDTPPAGAAPATDTTPGVRVGIYTSLTLDRNGLPQIAYMAHALPDGMGGFSAELRFARGKTATPAAASDFTIGRVDQMAITCQGLCAANSVCEKMSQKCLATATGCAPGCSSTQGCVRGASGPTCVDILGGPKSYDLPEGVGLFAQAARLANDDPLIVYHDRTNGNLKLARFTSSDMMWHLSVLDGQDAMAMDTGDVGQWCSVAVGAGDTIHISYQDAIADSLRYLQLAPGGAAPLKELVDDGARADGPHSVGDDTHIMLDGAGRVRIVYQDGRAVTMQMAQRMGAGTWTHMDLPAPMSAVGHGFFPKLVADGAVLWASDFYYDRSVRPFGQLEVLRLQ